MQVLEIVNQARKLVKERPLEAVEYDDGTEADMSQVKTLFDLLYADLVDEKKDEFKSIWTVNTLQGLNKYPINFDTNYLAKRLLWRIDTNGTDDFPVYHRSEDEIRALQPDLNDIPEGRPTYFFIYTDDDADGTKRLGFHPSPDGEYLFQGFKQVDPSILSLNAADMTKCTGVGDRYLIYALAAEIDGSDGFIYSARYAKKAASLKRKYSNSSRQNLETAIRPMIPTHNNTGENGIYGFNDYPPSSVFR